MIRRRNDRQDAIRSVVRNSSVSTQKTLVEELSKLGFECTQATVSRDITDMGLKKLPEGFYVLAEDLHFHQMVSSLVVAVTQVGNLVLVKSHPGTAPGVGAAIDDADLPHIAGTLAGDDTVLVVMEDDVSAAEFREMISKHTNE